MKLRQLSVFVILLVLASCQKSERASVAQVQPKPARTVSELPEGIKQAAEQVAFRAVQASHPRVDPAPVANCIRDNATDNELLALADGALNSTTPEEQLTVANILQRPLTNQCVIDNGQVLNP